MKQFGTVILGVVLLLAGCGRSVDSRLESVNALCDSNDVERAMAVLRGVCRDSLSEHNRHYYDLMSIKTRDKAYQDITGDTVITDIIDYFDGNGNDYEKGEAYYYGGRVYREMGDVPQALDYFQKALDAFPEDEAMMKGKTASQMGQIFLELYMFEHAKPKFQEAIAYQTVCGDSIGLMYNYRNLGDVLSEINKSDSAIINYRRALDFALLYETSKTKEIEVRSSLINHYISQGDYEMVKQEFNVFDTLSHAINRDYVLFTKINVHIINKEYSKAIDLALRLKNSQSLTSKIFAYSILLDYSKEVENNDSIYYYAISHKHCIDSLDLQMSTNAVIHQNSFYNYSIRENKIFKLEKKHLKSQVLLLFSIILLIYIIVLSFYIYNKVKRRNIHLINRNKFLIQSNDKLNQELTERLLKIEHLENDVQNLNNQIVEEYSAISQLSVQVRNNMLARMQNITKAEVIITEKILSSDVYNELKHSIKEKNSYISDECWKDLDNLINTEYPNFKKRIQILYPNINETEYKLCLVIKCCFSISECAFLINRERSNVPKMRKRLYEKLFHIEGEPSDFDKFISLL